MIAYRPEPFTDFRLPAEEAAIQASLGRIRKQLGADYPILAGGKPVMTQSHIVSFNPSAHSEVVGRIAKADKALAELSVQAAAEAYPAWSQTSAELRAELLFKAAAIMRRRKHDYNGWLIVEAGKTRAEADAETAEAIDFMEYYGRQMLRLLQRGEQELVSLPGERNRLDYIPLGVGIVIPPWNFPLAILAGMTTAAIVAGNTVVLKPASTTPIVAYKFVELLIEAGMPAGVVNLLPGSGAEIGDYLVGHKLTRFVSFTGSREVGVRMYELAARTPPGQIWLKRFVGELGGKDGIVVDRDADLEQASQAIVASAFGYSGQKCSACSRAIIHQDVYDEVLGRCEELTGRLQLGDSAQAQTYIGPVIDSQAFGKIQGYLKAAPAEGRIVTGGGSDSSTGYFIEPTIVADVEPEARLMQEEIFGPVVAFCRARDFGHALHIANSTEYGLTGSLFTRSRSHIEQAKSAFHVGNLYFNRKCTGALVGIHPFGGFNLSGTDSKAGGPDYLLQFTQPKLTSELL